LITHLIGVNRLTASRALIRRLFGMSVPLLIVHSISPNTSTCILSDTRNQPAELGLRLGGIGFRAAQ